MSPRFLRRAIICLAVAAAPFGHAAHAAPATPAAHAAAAEVTHVVQHGHTIEAIAHRYHVTVKAIVDANHLKDPKHLKPGEVLVIPGVHGHATHGAPAAGAPAHGAPCVAWP